VKNKVAAPFKTAEFDIMFGGGISSEGDLLDLALADGLAEKTGAWFSYGQVRLGQGRENSKLFLRDNPDLAKELRQAIIAKRMPAPAPATSKAASGSAGEVAKPAAGKDKDTKEAGKAKAAAAAIAARKIARKG